MNTAYEIIPATRTWPNHVEQLAQDLVAFADDRDQRAALSILLRGDDPIICRDQVHTRYTSHNTYGTWVRWVDLAAAVRAGHLPQLPKADRAMILLACSLAHAGISVPLALLLAELDQSQRDVVLSAVAYACEVTR